MRDHTFAGSVLTGLERQRCYRALIGSVVKLTEGVMNVGWL